MKKYLKKTFAIKNNFIIELIAHNGKTRKIRIFMDVVKLYPDYIKTDRRQEFKEIFVEKRIRKFDRRKKKRLVLLNKILRDIRKIKHLFD